MCISLAGLGGWMRNTMTNVCNTKSEDMRNNSHTLVCIIQIHKTLTHSQSYFRDRRTDTMCFNFSKKKKFLQKKKKNTNKHNITDYKYSTRRLLQNLKQHVFFFFIHITIKPCCARDKTKQTQKQEETLTTLQMIYSNVINNICKNCISVCE